MTSPPFAATARDAAQAPVNARIYVGRYEARVSPIADTDPATNAPARSSANNLDATAAFAPGTYEFVADRARLRRGALPARRSGPARRRRSRCGWRPTSASKTQGATATGDATAVTVDGPAHAVQTDARRCATT